MSTKNTKYGSKELKKDFGPISFADILLAHRFGEEMTQKEMAKFLNISEQNLCDLEKGRKIPSISRAASIAEKLELPVQSFVQLAMTDQLRRENLDFIVELKSA